ncbi:transposase [Pseudomonas sp. BIC9C]|uniref:transposase n=1 Tax=Pseudomonas sp. BIC9C TaxID=3078458 RepID=UPI003A5213FD
MRSRLFSLDWLVPKQHSTGDKTVLLGISKRGDRNQRRLLIQCARVSDGAGTTDRSAGRLGPPTAGSPSFQPCGLRWPTNWQESPGRSPLTTMNSRRGQAR